MAVARHGDQAVEQRQEARDVGRVAAQEPLAEHRRHRVGLLVDAAVRLEHPEQALAKRRRRLERVDAEVRQRAPQLVEEAARQVAAARLERPQVGEQVLLGAQRALLLVALGRGVTAEDRRDVDEDPEQVVLGAPPLGIGLVERLRGARVLADQALGLDRVDVEAEHQAAQILQQRRHAEPRAPLQLADAGLDALQDRARPRHPPVGPLLRAARSPRR